MGLKEIYFYQYCPTCLYKDKTEADDPCWDCLNEPVNEDSHKPVKYKKKED